MADITPAHNPGNTARPYLTPAIPVTTAIHRTSTVRRDIPMVMIVAGKTKVQLNKYVVAVKRIQPSVIPAVRPRPLQTKACPRQYRPAGRIVRNQPRPVVTSTMLPPVDHPRPLQTKACPRQYRPAGRIVRNQPQPVVTSTMPQIAAHPRPAPMRAMFPLAHQVIPVLKLPLLAVTPATPAERRPAVTVDITPAHNPGNTARPYLTPAIPVTTAIHRTSTVRRDIPMVMIVAGKTKVQLNKYVVAVKRIQPSVIPAVRPRPLQTKACPRQYRPAGRIVRNQPRPVVTSTMLPPVDHPRPAPMRAMFPLAHQV